MAVSNAEYDVHVRVYFKLETQASCGPFPAEILPSTFQLAWQDQTSSLATILLVLL